MGKKSANISPAVASVAHLVERHLAKVEVASSSLVTRSKKRKTRLLMVPIGTFSEPGGVRAQRRTAEAVRLCVFMPQPHDCFFLCEFFYHVRCVVALPHGRIQCADVPVHDPDALTSGTGVFLRPLPDLDALDEQPQQLRISSSMAVYCLAFSMKASIGDRGFQPLQLFPPSCGDSQLQLFLLSVVVSGEHPNYSLVTRPSTLSS